MERGVGGWLERKSRSGYICVYSDVCRHISPYKPASSVTLVARRPNVMPETGGGGTGGCI